MPIQPLGLVKCFLERCFMDTLGLNISPDPPHSSLEWKTFSTPGESDACKLRVLSMNVWALPVAPLCTERIHRIAEGLKDQWDIVVFQEVWHRRERNILLQAAISAGYKYYHYFQSAIGFPVPFGIDAFGTGLLVLSRYPILEAIFHRFSLSGGMFALHEADYIANKGVGMLRIASPGGSIDLYVTHLVANYNLCGAPGPGDTYHSQRAGEAYELSKFINATNQSDLVIVCGDFNSPPDCLCSQTPKILSHLTDVFAERQISEELYTFASVDNKFSHGDHAMRMDYIFYRNKKEEETERYVDSSKENNYQPSKYKQRRWRVTQANIYKQFFVNSKGEDTPVSDHFGVTAEFSFDLYKNNDPFPSPLSDLIMQSSGSIDSLQKQIHMPYCCARDGKKDVLDEKNKGKTSQIRPVKSLKYTLNESQRNISIQALPREIKNDRQTEITTKGKASIYPFTPELVTNIRVMECLGRNYDSLVEGRTQTIRRRTNHFYRAMTATVLLVILYLGYSPTSLDWCLRYVSTPLLVGYIAFEYTIAFYATTLECASFSELMSQIRLDMCKTRQCIDLQAVPSSS